jgi:hypothetical protein
MMNAASLFMLFWILFMYLGASSHAAMISWVDKKGVRHYSNVAAPDSKTTIENANELEAHQKSSGEGRETNQRDRFAVMEMYEEEKEKDIKEKKQAEIRSYREKVKRLSETSKIDKKPEKEKRENNEKVKSRKKKPRASARERDGKCEEMKRKIRELRSSGWENYRSTRSLQGTCSEHIVGGNGRVYRNNKCIEQKNRYRRAEYEQAIKAKENQYKMFCGK